MVDKFLQYTQFSNGISIIANFSDHENHYLNWEIPMKSIIIVMIIESMGHSWDTRESKTAKTHKK